MRRVVGRVFRAIGATAVVLAGLGGTAMAWADLPQVRSDPTTAPHDRIARVRRATDVSATATIPAMTFERRHGVAPACAPACPEWLQAVGRIEKGSLAKLKKAVAQLRTSAGAPKIPILISSPGGDVDESYAMGRFIRASGLSVSVGSTAGAVCPPEQDVCKAYAVRKLEPGRPGDNGVCASSCVFVLAGGVQRNIPTIARVGVHQFKRSGTYTKVLQKYRMVMKPGSSVPVKEVISEKIIEQRALDSKPPPAAYDKAQAYFKEMGVTADLMPFIKNTPHETIHELTSAEIAQAKLATERKPSAEFIGVSATAAVLTRPEATDVATLGSKIQQQLVKLNCLTGKTDGAWDERTRDAIRKFAEASGFSNVFSAEPDSDTLRKLANAAKGCTAPAR